MFSYTKKDTFLSLIIHLCPLLIMYLGICDVPKDSKMLDYWLASTPCFLWCHIMNSICGTSVQIWMVQSTSGQKVFGIPLLFN